MFQYGSSRVFNKYIFFSPSGICTFCYVIFTYADLSENIEKEMDVNSPVMMLDLIYCLLSAAV